MSRPKPEDQRRNFSATRETAHADSIEATAPPTPEGLHPEAAAWFESLSESGQASLYEASDWAMAVVGARLLNDWYENQRSTSMQGWQKICDRLVSSEQARRQALVELNRVYSRNNAAGRTTAAEQYKRALGIAK